MAASSSTERQTVLFILPNLAGGGAERAALVLMSRLDRRLYQPMLGLIRREGELLAAVPPDVPTASGWLGLLRLARRADLLIGGLELTATYLAVLLGFCLNRPVLGWVHTQLLLYPPARKPVHRLCQRIFYPRLDRVAVVSAGAATAVRLLFPALQDKITVLPNPVAVERIRQLSATALEWKEPTPLLLGIGKLDPNKGFELAVRLHAELLRRQVGQHLVILGCGPERARLMALAEELGVAGSVFLPGYVENPYPWIARAAAVVLPSRVEGLSTVVIEALALGRPVVSTDCPGGLREISLDAPGAIVPVDDLPALVRAVQTALEEPDFGAWFAENGPAVAEGFQTETVVRQWEVMLEQNFGHRESCG